MGTRDSTPVRRALRFAGWVVLGAVILVALAVVVVAAGRGAHP